MAQQRKVAILIFDAVEVLDFTGPYEVFSVVGTPGEERAFEVFTVAEKPGPITARYGLSINPTYTFADCPPPDILVIPGGNGTRREMNNPAVIEWIQAQYPRLELLMSVCTGALVLAKTGLLNGLRSTSHFNTYDLLQELAPETTVCPGARYLDNGKIITSAGVSAGIDAAFHAVAQMLGDEVAEAAAHYIEYEYWPPEDLNLDI